MSTIKKEKEEKKYYKCKDCGEVSTILTLGDVYRGCANCGGNSGFLQKEGEKGEWHERNYRTPELDKLNRRLNRFLN
jgi:predicted  nucleic acid-binding Zn-ribbon protein